MSRSEGRGGAQADLERLLLTEEGAGAEATGEMPKGFRTRRQESRVRMRGLRVETEQEEPGVTPVTGGGGGQTC